MTTTIRAIETRYKGYRFRSRLEARWAVFFDELGEEWRYEEQGYDLGELGWYLPDFYLPKRQFYAEIKPAPDDGVPPVLRFYFAGKIARDACWRQALITDGDNIDVGDEWAVRRIRGTRHACVGPYFMEFDDHRPDVERDHGYEADHHDGVDRGDCVRRCLAAIDQCDVFYAWLDAADCYGTLTEMGYAKALGKRVWVGCGDGFEAADDMWFARQMAERHGYGDNPGEVLAGIAGRLWNVPEQLKAEAVAKFAPSLFASGDVFYGDPLDKHGGWFPGWMVSNPKYQTARRAARAARFEHGERG